MSFWNKAFDVAKNAGTSLINEIESNANEIREIKSKYENKSDEELIRIINNDSFFASQSKKEKGVAFGILKKRGYSAEDIKA
ncbi:hypothetical protein [Aliivibrio fischeri]|uniref:hypothetical protein n=1 Tax=Aliivibrio fischeri TaxID=668 RepID=UPI0003032959|nr:hypothetical protein [Aliivibrio fischeri]OEE15973.1 hypothetical protein A1Q3_16930 [Aliivibrio fischeri ZF-211]